MRVKFTLTGTTPLIPQSDELSNPMSPRKKEYNSYTSKRKKTDEDQEMITKIEWYAALYYSQEIGPYIPAVNIWASFRDGGKFTKHGADIERALYMDADPVPLLYKGTRDRDKLWKDENFRFLKSVVVQRQRTPRMRPIFHTWALECEGTLLDDYLDYGVLQNVVRDAGQLSGLGTYRRGGYGRYTVKTEEVE